MKKLVISFPLLKTGSLVYELKEDMNAESFAHKTATINIDKPVCFLTNEGALVLGMDIIRQAIITLT